MAKAELENLTNCIKRLRRNHSKNIQKIFVLNDEIEFAKSRQLEYEILKKVKLLKRIKRKLRRRRFLRQRYFRKILNFRKKLKKKLCLKAKVEAKLEQIRRMRLKRRERLRKNILIRRLVRKRRLMRLQQLAERGKSDRKIYIKELKAQKRRRILLKKRPKREHPAMKKMKRRIRKTKARHATLEEDIVSIRSSINAIQHKRTTLKRFDKSLKKKVSDLQKVIDSEHKSIMSHQKVSKSSLGSLKSGKFKKTVRLRNFSTTQHTESCPVLASVISNARDKYVPFEVLVGRKSPVTITMHKKGKKEPMPIGDTKGLPVKGRFFHRRRRRKGFRNSSTSTSGNITPTSNSSARERKRNSKSSERSLPRRKLQREAGDLFTEKSSSPKSNSLAKSKDIFRAKYGKKSTANLNEMRRNFKKFKSKNRFDFSYERPVNKTTLKSFYLPSVNHEYFQVPRHSTSKPSYSGGLPSPTPEPVEKPRKRSVYDEKYFKNLVKTQSQSIRDLIQTERKLKKAQLQKKEQDEEEEENRRQREQNTHRKHSSLYNNENELELLVQAGLRSQFKLFDVIPGETPVINEDILKMSDKGERINIRDLMPTSKIFEWTKEWPSPPTSSRSVSLKPATAKKFKKKRSSKSKTAARHSRRTKPKDDSHKARDSDESNDELGSEVTVKQLWEVDEPWEERQILPEEIEEDRREIEVNSVKKKKIKTMTCKDRKSQAEEQEIKVVCSPCGMTTMQPGGPCCRFKPKKCMEE